MRQDVFQEHCAPIRPDTGLKLLAPNQAAWTHWLAYGRLTHTARPRIRKTARPRRARRHGSRGRRHLLVAQRRGSAWPCRAFAERPAYLGRTP